jgi:hypothetical protein
MTDMVEMRSWARRRSERNQKKHAGLVISFSGAGFSLPQGPPGPA